MSLLIDTQYAPLVRSFVSHFKIRNPSRYIFACPFCGDNPKKRAKAGNIYKPRDKDYLWFHCFRCGESLSMRSFLERLDVDLADQYRKETRTEWFDRYNVASIQEQPRTPPYMPCKPDVLKGLTSIKSLPEDHPAKAYILSRQIPMSFHHVLFWTDDFQALARKIRPDGHYDNLVRESRLVVPFFDENYQFTALQGRSLNPDAEIRYLTIKVHDDAPKIYGLHRQLDHTAPICLVEGPFDSMFLPNCLAVGGSDIPDSLSSEAVVVVYDNEPRRKQTVQKMLRTVENGFRVCVWPDHIIEKDINEMILAGRSQSTILKLIDESTYMGRTAKRRINDWKRV